MHEPASLIPPRDLGGFVGRERESAELLRLLAEAPLVTLAGPGGAGKTRLALHVARRLLDAAPPRAKLEAALVDLAGVNEPTQVARALAAALGVEEDARRPLTGVLIDALRARRLLVVLDNCEHLVGACAEVVDGLLRACPELQVLATSREPLGVQGEEVFRVPPLEVPAEGSPDACAASEAVQLFVQRARAVRREFVLDATTAPAVAEICRRLDGLPLAIELAAAQAASLSVSDIAARLERSAMLLVSPQRTVPPRQQTLEAAITWSYDLLSADERHVFARLAVFAGGFSLEDAEALGVPDTDTLARLHQLVSRSMVQVEALEDGCLRYRLLEPLRQFGRARLRDQGQLEDACRQHAQAMVALMERAGAELQGPAQVGWYRRLGLEVDNLRAALDWAEAAGEAETALRLAAPWLYWTRPDRQAEGRARLARVVALAGAERFPGLRNRALGLLAVLAVIQGDLPTGRVLVQQTLAAARTHADTWLETHMLRADGLTSLFSGDLPHAQAALQQALDLAREQGELTVAARVLDDLAGVAVASADLASAEARLRESLALTEAGLDPWSQAMTLNSLGDLLRTRGDADGAAAAYNQALPTFSALNGGRPPHGVLHNLAYVALARDDPSTAIELFLESADTARRVGADRRGVAECVIGLGSAALRLGQPRRAACLFAAAEAALEGLGTRITPSNRADYERGRAQLNAALRAESLAELEHEGRVLTLEQALDLARDLPRTGAAEQPRVAGLTARELEVAELLARGLRNRQIADTLVITEKTAANHVQRVLDKLGLRSRAQVAARAAELGLTGTGPPRG